MRLHRQLRRGLTATAAALAGIAAAPPPASPPPPTELELARQLLSANQPAEALAKVTPIIDKALLGEARDPHAICPGAAAAVFLAFLPANVTITTENDWCDAMLIKGFALNELKRPAEAATLLETLVGHAPDNPHYLVELAFTVRSNGQTERALSLYRQAERTAGKLRDKADQRHWRAAALRGQGYVLAELQGWDEATAAYRNSQRDEPDSDIARRELQYIADHRPR